MTSDASSRPSPVESESEEEGQPQTKQNSSNPIMEILDIDFEDTALRAEVESELRKGSDSNPFRCFAQKVERIFEMRQTSKRVRILWMVVTVPPPPRSPVTVTPISSSLAVGSDLSHPIGIAVDFSSPHRPRGMGSSRSQIRTPSYRLDFLFLFLQRSCSHLVPLPRETASRTHLDG